MSCKSDGKKTGKLYMENNKFLYNNEAIALISILAILRETKELEYSKSFLILPFLLNDNIVNFIRRKNSIVIGIQDLISRRIENFSNFNKSFKNFTPLTFNTLLLGHELGVLKLNPNYIELSDNETFDFESKILGNRVENILTASKKLIPIFEKDSAELYSSLKIIL